MKRYFLIFSVIIILALVVMVAIRLSSDALAVVIGMGLGILASVPTSFLLFYTLNRQPSQGGTSSPNQQNGLSQGQHPPVVIVNGGQQPQISASAPPAYQMQVPSQRKFTIVGEEATDL